MIRHIVSAAIHAAAIGTGTQVFPDLLHTGEIKNNGLDLSALEDPHRRIGAGILLRAVHTLLCHRLRIKVLLTEHRQLPQGGEALSVLVPQQIEKDIHVVAAFGQHQRATGLVVVPRAADIAVGIVVIADVLIVLDGDHRAKPSGRDDVPNLLEKASMAEHMAHRHHLLWIAPGQAQ